MHVSEYETIKSHKDDKVSLYSESIKMSPLHFFPSPSHVVRAITVANSPATTAASQTSRIPREDPALS